MFGGDKSLLPIREAVARRSIPYVALSGPNLGSDHRIVLNNGMGIRQALDHLCGLGHTEVGCITADRTSPDILEREQAFLAEAAARRITVLPDWMRDAKLAMHHSENAAPEILASSARPTALVCLTDEMGAGALRAAYKLGIRVPDDLSVTGFDDFVHSHASTPSLTTVRQPVTAMGARAVTLLLELIEGREIPESTTFEPQLIIRESTSAPKKGQNP